MVQVPEQFSKAPIIEHNVSLVGDLFYSYFPDGENTPAQFSIDGELAPDLLVRRGEIHRFYFDKSLDGHPFSFLKFQENTPPRFRINMLAEPQADSTKGLSTKESRNFLHHEFSLFILFQYSYGYIYGFK